MGNERYINTPATTTISQSVMTIYYGLLKIELHAVDPEWVVPGHGPVGTKKDVQKELKYFATIRDHLRARIAAGPSPGGAAATIDMGDFMEWPDADRYYGKAMRMYRDLTGKTFDQAATSAALDMYQKMTKK